MKQLRKINIVFFSLLMALSLMSAQTLIRIGQISMNTGKLLGRGTAGTGAVEEITLGTNLSFTGTTLNATGSGGGLSDADYGDITVSGTGTVMTIDNLTVTNAKLAGSIAASKLVGSDITTVGTISSGTWNGTAVANTYIATGLDAAKLNTGVVSNTEFNYLDNVTSAIQTQLDAKLTIAKKITRETPSGSVNSSNTTYTLANTPVSGTEEVFLNGVLQEPGAGNDYTISTNTITYLTAPTTGDRIRVTYISQ